MHLTKRDLHFIRDILLDVWLGHKEPDKETAGGVIDKIEAQLKAPSPKEFWITYDVQAERWRVQETPFECDEVRAGMRVHHVKELSTEKVGDK